MRNFLVLFLGAAFLAQASGQRGVPDPAFEKIPLDQWLGERNQALFHWKANVPRADLSFYQRLIARVEISLDGRDLEARRNDKRLVFFVQITDGDGTRYRNHGSIELSKLDENVKAANLEYSQPAFFLPGEYRLVVAILDTTTGEHSTIQAQFRVAPPKQGFLLEAWRDLPPVEFIDKGEAADDWYLPGIRGRLQWAASLHSAAQLNVLLNLAPSAPGPGSRSTPNSGLTVLLPTLKAITQTGSAALSEHVEVLDLARRRAVFKQDDVHDLDWPRLKASLGEANTASIDVHSLSERHHDAQFFVSEVRGVLRASEKACVLVVLSKSVAFEAGENLDPISLEALPACRVIYIRYRAPAQLVRPFGREMGGRGRSPRNGAPMTRDRSAAQDLPDQLEATLKPLGPKVFDVETPEQMTKALEEIGKILSISGGQSSR